MVNTGEKKGNLQIFVKMIKSLEISAQEPEFVVKKFWFVYCTSWFKTIWRQAPITSRFRDRKH